MNVTTSEIVAQVAQRTGQSTENVKAALEAAFAVVGESAALGHKVTLKGFATVEGVDKPERIVSNPRNGDPIVVAAHRAPRLKPLTGLKDVTAGRVPIKTGRG